MCVVVVVGKKCRGRNECPRCMWCVYNVPFVCLFVSLEFHALKRYRRLCFVKSSSLLCQLIPRTSAQILESARFGKLRTVKSSILRWGIESARQHPRRHVFQGYTASRCHYFAGQLAGGLFPARVGKMGFLPFLVTSRLPLNTVLW